MANVKSSKRRLLGWFKKARKVVYAASCGLLPHTEAVATPPVAACSDYLNSLHSACPEDDNDNGRGLKSRVHDSAGSATAQQRCKSARHAASATAPPAPAPEVPQPNAVTPSPPPPQQPPQPTNGFTISQLVEVLLLRYPTLQMLDGHAHAAVLPHLTPSSVFLLKAVEAGAYATVHLAVVCLPDTPGVPGSPPFRALCAVKTMGWRAARVERHVHASCHASRFLACHLAMVDGHFAGVEPPKSDDDDVPPPPHRPAVEHSVMELAVGGDLMDVLVDLEEERAQKEEEQRLQPGEAEAALLPEAAARYALGCVVEGLAAMHARCFLHRDVKPHNVLLYGAAGLKLCDFNLAERVSSSTGQVTEEDCCGTPGFQAPEMRAFELYGLPADVYSAGMTLQCMLAGPSRTLPGGEDGLPAGVSADAAALVAGMTHEEPAERLTLQQVRCHAWFDGFDWAALRAGTMPVPEPFGA